jgi:hypothetical protein
MGNRTTRCIKALGLLEKVSQWNDGWGDMWTFPSPYFYDAEPELQSMARFFRSSHFEQSFFASTPAITPLILHFISAQNPREKHMKSVLHYFNPDAASLRNLAVLADF